MKKYKIYWVRFDWMIEEEEVEALNKKHCKELHKHAFHTRTEAIRAARQSMKRFIFAETQRLTGLKEDIRGVEKEIKRIKKLYEELSPSSGSDISDWY